MGLPSYSESHVAIDTPVTAPAPLPNPWRSMWFSPRDTIRRLLQAETRPSWVPVVVVAAVGTALGALQLDDHGALSFSRSSAPVVIGVMQLVFAVLVGPIILALVAGPVGSDADASDIREAVAWSHVPVAVASVVWALGALLIGSSVFAGQIELESAWDVLGALLLVIAGVCYVWTIPTMVGGLAGAMRSSIGKALLVLLIVSVPALVLRAVM